MNGTTKTNGAHVSSDNGSQVHRTADGFSLLVGTFRSPELYNLQFQPPPACSASSSKTKPRGVLTVSAKSPAAGGHSWLALSPSHAHLYATVWASPPLVAAYALDPATKQPTLLNTAPVASLAGYVALTPAGTHLLSVGGPSGEVFALDPRDGALLRQQQQQQQQRDADGDDGVATTAAPPVQRLAFRAPSAHDDGRRDGVAHGAFGGLRWGAHSVDVAPDGRAVYVADIGHNCIWTFDLDEQAGGEVLVLREKLACPRTGDGPRHCWPHPGGRVVYCVQEHSGMVDAFAVGGGLAHMHGFSLLPAGKDAGQFWADEVRTSNLPAGTGGQHTPRWLYASTRGLDTDTKGYVAVFELDAEGAMVGPAVEIYETRTSGGLANAVEPAPRALYEQLRAEGQWDGEEEFIALTDSEEGWVVVLGWNGTRFREVAAVRLDGVQAATAVWV